MSKVLGDDVVWHGIPRSEDRSTCTVYLMQAGGLTLPTSLVMLPGTDTTEPEYASIEQANKDSFYVPDYCFLIEHGVDKFIFDLGMREDLENSPPAVVENTLPNFKCFPESPASILRTCAKDHPPESIKAVIFSHLHFDHVGDPGAAGFEHAELWVGPTSMTSARPGYPTDPKSSNWSKDFPTDGSRVIVEFSIPEWRLKDDNRLTSLHSSRARGDYQGVEQREMNWFALGLFENACDAFGDASAYIIDAPGHMAGHMMLLLRVKINKDHDDDFILLAGDCYHHPALLRNPRLTARPPYSTRSMHSDSERAVDTITRTKAFAEQSNVWVVGAHDSSVGEAIMRTEGALDGLVLLNDWHQKRWKTE